MINASFLDLTIEITLNKLRPLLKQRFKDTCTLSKRCFIACKTIINPVKCKSFIYNN